MRASEAGLGPYSGPPGRATTLLTFDRQLAAAAEDLNYVQRVDGPAGRSFVTTADTRKHLQRDMLRDSAMLDRLDAWCLKITELQVERWGRPRTAGPAQIALLLGQALNLSFS